MYNCFYHLGRVVLQVTCITLLVTEYFKENKEKFTRICLPFYIRYQYVFSIHAFIFKCTWSNGKPVEKLWILIKFELSIFVIWSSPVDKVAVFQSKNRSTEGIAEYISRVQIQPVPINKFSRVTGFLYWHTLSCKAIRFCGILLHILIIYLFGIPCGTASFPFR